MKLAITLALAILGGIIAFIGLGKTNSYPVFFDSHGQLTGNLIKIFGDTVTPTSSTFSIDISAAGFTTVKSVAVTAQMNTATVAVMPIIVVKTVTATAIVVNILTQNNAVVSIVGVNVLSGAPLIFASSTSGMLLNVQVQGV